MVQIEPVYTQCIFVLYICFYDAALNVEMQIDHQGMKSLLHDVIHSRNASPLSHEIYSISTRFVRSPTGRLNRTIGKLNLSTWQTFQTTYCN